MTATPADLYLDLMKKVPTDTLLEAEPDVDDPRYIQGFLNVPNERLQSSS